MPDHIDRSENSAADASAERQRPPATGVYSVAEEIAHVITHGAGLLLSIAGLVVLVVIASLRGDSWHIVSVAVYGSTLVILYAASTLYHALPSPNAKAVLRTLDHAAIFLLIAGTYTPFTLVNLRGGWGWALFGTVWVLALLGVVLEAAAKHRVRILSHVLYIGLGWLVAIAIKPLLSAVAFGGLVLLVVGGLAYTGGVVFYAWRRLPFNHAVWHVFVLAGSVCHFFAVLLFVIPGANP
jgi:hemolysin III